MARLKSRQEEKVEIPIAPMIDCVFLMLIYFMVTSSLEKQEADLTFSLPGCVQQGHSLDLPAEQIIEIRTGGEVFVNDYPYDKADSPRFSELAALLSRFKQECDLNKTECSVNISPAPDVVHQTIVKVMDAIAVSGIDKINFSGIGE